MNNNSAGIHSHQHNPTTRHHVSGSLRQRTATAAASSDQSSPTSQPATEETPSPASTAAAEATSPTTIGDSPSTSTYPAPGPAPTTPGYDSLASGLPRGTLPYLIAEQFPEEFFNLRLASVLRGLAIPLSLMAAGYCALWYGHSFAPLWQTLLAWLAIGTGYTGVFTVAHTASHYALLPDADPVQDIIGAVLMAPALVAFNPWRDRFIAHIAAPNMLHQDPAGWQPVTVRQLRGAGPLQRLWLRLCCTTPLKLLGSVAHWFSSWGEMDLNTYQPLDRRAALMSWAVPLLFMGFAWPGMVAAGGLAGWATWWLMPWLVFHLWLSTLTLLQHTAPHIPFHPPGPDYDMGRAVISGTVTVALPRWLELLLNDANYHLPQHLSPAIPFYHARAAQAWLSTRLGPYLTQTRLSWGLVSGLLTRCQVWDESSGVYRGFREVEADLEAEAAQARDAQAEGGGAAAVGAALPEATGL
ncbi:MAG: hypothetical protein WDW36_007614 [Sanguina aurantia]